VHGLWLLHTSPPSLDSVGDVIMAKTWKQLKAEGIYTDGSQCRRRETEHGFCTKHQKLQDTIDLITSYGGNG